METMSVEDAAAALAGVKAGVLAETRNNASSSILAITTLSRFRWLLGTIGARVAGAQLHVLTIEWRNIYQKASLSGREQVFAGFIGRTKKRELP